MRAILRVNGSPRLTGALLAAAALLLAGGPSARAGVADDEKATTESPAPAPDSGREHGLLGVQAAPIPQVLQNHLGIKDGVLIDRVQPGSAAEKAGLQRFDLLLTLDGRALGGVDDLVKKLAATRPGQTLKVGLLRSGKKDEVDVTLGAAPGHHDRGGEPGASAPPAASGAEESRGFLGVWAGPIPAELRAHLDLPKDEGVLVMDVLPGSGAEEAQVRVNDVIVAVDGKAVHDVEEFVKGLGGRKAGEKVSLDILQKNARKTVEATLKGRPNDLPGASLVPFGDDDLDPRSGLRGAPRTFRRGRIVVEGPDGRRMQTFDLPDTLWQGKEDFEKAIQKLHADLEAMKLNFDEEGLHTDLERLLQRFNPDRLLRDPNGLDQDSKGDGSDLMESSSSYSVVTRLEENGLDVTLEEKDGLKTVSVKRGDEVLADKLPFADIGKLPEDVRKVIQRLDRKGRGRGPGGLGVPSTPRAIEWNDATGKKIHA